MFSKFTTRIWKAPDVSQEMQPINDAASTTCRPRRSPYPTCLVPTDNDPLGNIGKRWYTVRIIHWLSTMPNLWFLEVPKPMTFNVETSASLPETSMEHDMTITARPDERTDRVHCSCKSLPAWNTDGTWHDDHCQTRSRHSCTAWRSSCSCSIFIANQVQQILFHLSTAANGTQKRTST